MGDTKLLGENFNSNQQRNMDDETCLPLKIMFERPDLINDQLQKIINHQYIQEINEEDCSSLSFLGNQTQFDIHRSPLFK